MISWGAEEEEVMNTHRGGARAGFGSSYLGGFIDPADAYSSPGHRDENEELRREWSQEISG